MRDKGKEVELDEENLAFAGNSKNYYDKSNPTKPEEFYEAGNTDLAEEKSQSMLILFLKELETTSSRKDSKPITITNLRK